MSDMIKIKRKNYIKEKAQEKLDRNISDQIGSFHHTLYDEKYGGRWGVKKKINHITLAEDNYQINEILKKFQRNKNEIKGFSSKYLLQLSDLLGQKDKNFTKKRLELYHKRIAKTNNNNNEENNFQTYNSISNISNIKGKLKRIFDSKKSDSVTMYCTDRYKKNLSNFNKKKLKPLEINNRISKSYKNFELKPLPINKNKIAKALLLTQLNSNEDEDISYEITVDRKDEFIKYGDKDRYESYLKKEYDFFNNNNLNQMIFLNEKTQRKKLFKNIPNYKYLFEEKDKKCPYKTKLFNRISRKKSNESNFTKSRNFKNKTNEAKNNNKITFYEDCKKIYLSVKKNLL